MTFDPNAVVPLGEEGTVYPTLTLRDRWGALTVSDGGARIAADFTRAFIPAPAGGCAGATEDDHWSLDLAEGWSVAAVDATSDRPGDCVVLPRP